MPAKDWPFSYSVFVSLILSFIGLFPLSVVNVTKVKSVPLWVLLHLDLVHLFELSDRVAAILSEVKLGQVYSVAPEESFALLIQIAVINYQFSWVVLSSGRATRESLEHLVVIFQEIGILPLILEPRVLVQLLLIIFEVTLIFRVNFSLCVRVLEVSEGFKNLQFLVPVIFFARQTLKFLFKVSTCDFLPKHILKLFFSVDLGVKLVNFVFAASGEVLL